MNNLSLTPMSLVFSFVLVVLSLALSSKEKLGLNKEIIIAVARMIIQLIIAGFVLTYIFELDSYLVTTLAVLFMVFNAAYNASQRAKQIPESFKIALIAIFSGTVVNLLVLVLTGSLEYTPAQMVPITGMLVGNSMSIIGLSFRNLQTLFRDQRQMVNEKLALGADVKLASRTIIKEAISISIQPTIDSTRTVGLVLLPGMMSGMILAGAPPMQAIMYQIMVYFMMVSTSTITAIVANYLAYKAYFDSYGRYIGLQNKES